MIIFYVLLLLTVVLGLHLILLPLSKKRPILLIDMESAIFLMVLIASITFFIGPISYILGILAGILFMITGVWIIIGVSKENLIIALDKAILASRSEVVKNESSYIIGKSLKLNILRVYSKTGIVINRKISYSKKAILTRNIWKKFIQNYYI